MVSEQLAMSTLGQGVRPVMSEQGRHLTCDLAQGWNSNILLSGTLVTARGQKGTVSRRELQP